MFGVVKNITTQGRGLVFPKDRNCTEFVKANMAIVVSCVRTRLFFFLERYQIG